MICPTKMAMIGTTVQKFYIPEPWNYTPFRLLKFSLLNGHFIWSSIGLIFVSSYLLLLYWLLVSLAQWFIITAIFWRLITTNKRKEGNAFLIKVFFNGQNHIPIIWFSPTNEFIHLLIGCRIIKKLMNIKDSETKT